MNSLKGKAISNVCCMGVDYVGVVSCCVIAHMCPSINVAVVDLDPGRISPWNTKQIPSREPGLEEILRKCLNKNLVFTTDTESAIEGADVIFLSRDSPRYGIDGKVVPTHDPDIEKMAKIIAEVSKTSKIVVEKSTVPVGTHEILEKILNTHKRPEVEFQVLSNPEFYSSGCAVASLMSPERVLIGSNVSKRGFIAATALSSIYSQWVPVEKIITMKTWSAELAKISLNAFLAQRLASVNAMSIVCEETGGDISQVVKVLKKSSALGLEYLEPSFGFGGKHLQNDVCCLIYMCERLNLGKAADYWREVIHINECQKSRFVKKILQSFYYNLKNKRFAFWGFSYKKDTHIVEDSVAAYVCTRLLEEGAKIQIYDPKIERRQVLEALRCGQSSPWEKEVILCDDAYKAASKVHAIICCSDLEEFQTLDYVAVYKDMMRPPRIFDGRKYLPLEDLIRIGFVVETIGKVFQQNGAGDLLAMQ